MNTNENNKNEKLTRLDIFRDISNQIAEPNEYTGFLKLPGKGFCFLPVSAFYVKNTSSDPRIFNLRQIALNIFDRPVLMGDIKDDYTVHVDEDKYFEKKFMIEKYVNGLNFDIETKNIITESMMIPVIYKDNDLMVSHMLYQYYAALTAHMDSFCVLTGGDLQNHQEQVHSPISDIDNRDDRILVYATPTNVGHLDIFSNDTSNSQPKRLDNVKQLEDFCPPSKVVEDFLQNL